MDYLPTPHPLHFALGRWCRTGWNRRMADGNSDWNDSKLIARAVLHDRAARRRVLGWMVGVAFLQIVAGLWLVDGWLAKSPWIFLLWWGGLALLSCMVMLFAVYDALATFREEQEKHR